ncbi:hypothetical protein N806_31135 [Rhodococcus sp. P27]|nr:hypothetical protein N806_31135 [Rhodococcus sp. P27]
MARRLAAGSTKIPRVIVGRGSYTQIAQKVMMGTGSGTEMIWQALQGNSQSKGTFTVPQNSWTDLLTHTIVGNGYASITANYQWGVDALQWLNFNRQVRLLVNGAVVASNTWTGSTAGWTVALNDGPKDYFDGDVIKMQAYVNGTGRASARNVDSSSLWLSPTYHA